MPDTYATALEKLVACAQHQNGLFRVHAVNLPLSRTCTRIAQRTICSPETTPKFDTSAMDGYALNSTATATATVEAPVVFLVKGTMAAGDEPLDVSAVSEGDIYPCVEIMTGARFPEMFDCCVRLEDVESYEEEGTGRWFIKVMKPAKRNQHRRFAGGDFKEGDLIVPAGAAITPAQIMAMASVGITEVPVLRKPRVGVFSTGSELQPSDPTRPHLHRIRDANGPHLIATLQEWGVDTEFLGVLDDDAEAMAGKLRRCMEQDEFDVIISTGAVSTGRFDAIPASLQRLDARVVFHKIAIRPGHPALYAMIPDTDKNISGREVAYFGLPGNPVANAACLRFLVVPCLRVLQGQALEMPFRARVRAESMNRGRCNCTGWTCIDINLPSG